MDSHESQRFTATLGPHDGTSPSAETRVGGKSPENRTEPDAFVLKTGPVGGGIGALALDAEGRPIAFKLGADEDEALIRLRVELGARPAYCEPSLGGHGFPACLVPRAAIASRAALLALVRVQNVAPPHVTVDHMRAVLAGFASVWSAEPWSAGIDLAYVELSGAVTGKWRMGPMWQHGKLLGLAWIQHDGPVERNVIGGELERMAVLFTPEGFTGEAIEQAFGFRRIPVPMRKDGKAPPEEWVAMAAALSAFGALRTRPRATASAEVGEIECHATAWALETRRRA